LCRRYLRRRKAMRATVRMANLWLFPPFSVRSLIGAGLLALGPRSLVHIIFTRSLTDNFGPDDAVREWVE
jgi:hypothetical protein